MCFLYPKSAKTFPVICWLLLCLFFGQGLMAKGKHVPFSSKDIFQTAAFLSNKNLIPDYQNEKIWFYSSHDNIKAYFTESGVLYKMGPGKAENGDKDELNEKVDRDKDEIEPVPAVFSLVKMSWLGANAYPVIESGEKTPGYYTYLSPEGDSYKSLITEGYKTITYRDLYPGIDVVYSFPDKGGLKYNLVVKPGADVTKVKFTYNGEVKSLQKDANGDIIISTEGGDLTEHAPVSFSETGTGVASEFTLSEDKTIGFSFPEGYDSQQVLTIDPWQTALTVFTPDNIGFDVDYDTSGNAFVYGAGPNSVTDATHYFEVAKYNTAGANVWVFNGSVTSIGWNSYSTTLGNNYPGNILVEQSTGKIYVGKGHETPGTTIIRLTTAGTYDNFQSTVNNNFQEDWGIGYNCVNNSLLALGGDASANTNMAIVNTTTGAITISNITTRAGSHQDIICGVFDAAGNLYVVMDDYTDSTDIPYHATIYKVNAALNGNTWAVSTGYYIFSEEYNTEFWRPNLGSNWNNCLAANGSYLFYYDGYHLKAFNLTTGAVVGNATTVAGNTAVLEGGIAVDNCNNVYVGGIGNIKTFHFDGTNFNAAASIPLGGGFTTNQVEDVKYDATTNSIYATGIGFVGTYAAAISNGCNPITVANTCNTATATIQGAASVTYSYVWTNSAGTVVSQTANSAATTNTATGLSDGTYYVHVLWQANCNGATIFDSVTISCNSSVTVNDSTICAGGTAHLTAVGTPAGGTYSWSNGATTSSISVTPATTTSYTVTYTPLSGTTATATTTVTVNSSNPTVTVNNPSICGAGNATLTATPSIAGGTYLWSPGGQTTSSITVSPASTSQYTVTYSLACGSATATATVTVNSNPTVTVNNAAVCTGGTATLTAAGLPAGGTYAWSTGATTSSISVSPGANTTYTVTYTSLNCGSVSSTSTVAVANSATVTVSSDTICQGGSATLYATPSVAGGTYSWNTGGTVDSITVSPGTNTSYTVTYTPVGCPAATGTGSVTVEPIPAVTLAETNPGCSHGGVITATGTGGTAPYEYSLGGGAYQDVDSFTNLASGNYTVVTKDTFGCVSTPQTTTIAPYTPLSVSSTIDSITCTVTTGTINATAAGGTSPYQYSINGGAYQNSGTFTGLAAASYAVTVKDAAGCTTNETVVIPTASTISVQPSAVEVLCNGATDGKINATASGGSSPYQFSLNGGAYQNTGSFLNLAAGNYTVGVKDANGCMATQTVQITQPSPLIFVSVTATGITCPGLKNGTITAVGGGGTPPYNYVCTKDSVNFITTTNGIITGVDSGSYHIQLTDNNGCLITTNIQVPGATPDSFTVVADSATCNGNDGAVVVTPVFFQNAPFTYAINNGAAQSSDSFPGLAIGSYVVTTTDSHGCTSILQPVVVGRPAPAIAVAYPTDTTVRLGQAVQLGSYLTGGSVSVINSYIWEPGDGLSCQECQNPVSNPYADQITYTVTITYNGTCTADASVLVMNGTGEVYIPNVFTPNGDGNNDVFFVYGYGIKVMVLKVFNRWGEKVFESHDQLIGWDGTYKGRLQDPAVFVYEANVVFLDNRTRFLKGSVTLVR